jgi:hypothetical protein
MNKDTDISDALQIFAERHGYTQYFFFGMHADEKWLMTCSHTFSVENMTALRDYFTKQLSDA